MTPRAFFSTVIEIGGTLALRADKISGLAIKIEDDVDGFLLDVQLDVSDVPRGLNAQ
jgi:hypothetical protein